MSKIGTSEHAMPENDGNDMDLENLPPITWKNVAMWGATAAAFTSPLWAPGLGRFGYDMVQGADADFAVQDALNFQKHALLLETFVGGAGLVAHIIGFALSEKLEDVSSANIAGFSLSQKIKNMLSLKDESSRHRRNVFNNAIGAVCAAAAGAYAYTYFESEHPVFHNLNDNLDKHIAAKHQTVTQKPSPYKLINQ